MLALFFLLGSVFWVWPAPSQRALGQMRQLALMEGVRVRLGTDGDPARACYQLIIPALARRWTLERIAGATTGPVPEWRWVGAVPVLAAEAETALHTLLPLVVSNPAVLRVRASGLELWWDESADLERGAGIIEALKQLADALQDGFRSG